MKPNPHKAAFALVTRTIHMSINKKIALCVVAPVALLIADASAAVPEALTTALSDATTLYTGVCVLVGTTIAFRWGSYIVSKRKG